ncbi:MAG: fimbrillin family protein, partial [Tannerellaceae bacterium]
QNTSESFVLRGTHSSDTLFVQTTVLDGISSSAKTESHLPTRGTPVTDIATSYGAYGVFCYIEDQQNKTTHFYMYNEEVSYSGGNWFTDETYYWPGSNYNLKFYAYAPFNNADLVLPDATDAVAVPKLTYTVPSLVQEQSDLLVAVTDQMSGDLKKQVPLSFKHICTAIRFEAHEQIQSGVLQKITLKGIHGHGTYDMNAHTWSVDATTGEYTVEPRVDTGGGSSSITSGENTFMMIPQVIEEGATVEVTFKDNLTGIAKTFSSTLKGEWLIGKTVTYKISITPDYELDFIEEPTPQDAHYVIYPIKIKVDPALKNGWTLSTSSDWVTLRTDLTTLQKEGYWTWNERGERSISGNPGGEITVYAFLDENITDATREAQLILQPTGSQASHANFTISQLCPSWNGNVGAERIEENNGGPYPWGFKWDRKVTFTAKPGGGSIKDLFGAYVFKSIAEGYINDYNAESYVKITTKSFIFIYETTVTIDYSKLNSLEGVASNTDSGLTNTIALFTHQGIGSVSEIEKQLRANAVGNFTESESGGGATDIENFAAKMCVKKNKFTKVEKEISEGGVTTTYDVATIDDKDIVWYLPARDEFSSVSDQEYPYQGVYWTSTAYKDNVNAYYVQGSGGSSYGDRMTTYKVRAFRRR